MTVVNGCCGGSGAKLFQHLNKLLEDPKTVKKVSCEIIKTVNNLKVNRDQ